MDIPGRLKSLRKKLNLNQSEFAAILQVHHKTISYWERGTRDIQQTHLIDISDQWNISMEWLLLGIGSMYLTDQTLITSLNKTLQYKLINAIKTAKEFDSEKELEGILDEFSLFTKIKNKLSLIGTEQSFWKKLISGMRIKNSSLLILGKVLSSFETTLNTLEKLTEKNAKSILEKTISDYQLVFSNDKLKHFLTENEKDHLLKWVQHNLSDFDCYVIMRNVPQVLEILREEMNTFNKQAF